MFAIACDNDCGTVTMTMQAHVCVHYTLPSWVHLRDQAPMKEVHSAYIHEHISILGVFVYLYACVHTYVCMYVCVCTYVCLCHVCMNFVNHVYIFMTSLK
jgi:hypothetical protein